MTARAAEIDVQSPLAQAIAVAERAAHKLTVTIFADVQARSRTELSLTVDELAERVRNAKQYARKADCQLIKLAQFGDNRSEKNSLRNDANVIVITGIEGDYDGGIVSIADAQILLFEQKIGAILYTSPSHTEDKPRWRVLCPLSKSYAPSARTKFVARLNGALGGILAPESFALSQSFYVGRVVGAPYHVAQVRGQCIDELHELDAAAIYPPKKNGESKVARLHDLHSNDEVIIKLHAKNLFLRSRADGGADLICPFEIEHTTPRALGDCVYFPAHTGGFEHAHFKCLHSHCAARTDEDFLQAIGLDATAAKSVSIDDFKAYLPAHTYIFVPTREMWPAASVNAIIPPIESGRLDKNGDKKVITAAKWLDENKAIHQVTWSPGDPLVVEDKLVTGGGWIEHAGCATFNLYLPPVMKHGDPTKANRWLDLINKIYPDSAAHIIKWLAHRVQKPHEKPNHALVIGGMQGIGKDSALEPIKHAVGPWNFAEISPPHLLGRFNGFIKSVILRISEARDLGDVDRFAFYDHAKIYTAAPPDVLRCDEKNIREFSVLNVCGVLITTNHKADGIYLPADDRRHYVAWSDTEKTDFDADYWTHFYKWLAAEGNSHVAAYLAQLDLTDFDAKAPPPKTTAFWDIVDSNRAPEDAELADVIDGIGRPPALTLVRLVDRASGAFCEWLRDRRNRRQIPHRLESAGYVPVRNENSTDGLWKIDDKRQVIYARSTLSIRERLVAAAELVKR